MTTQCTLVLLESGAHRQTLVRDFLTPKQSGLAVISPKTSLDFLLSLKGATVGRVIACHRVCFNFNYFLDLLFFYITRFQSQAKHLRKFTPSSPVHSWNISLESENSECMNGLEKENFSLSVSSHLVGIYGYYLVYIVALNKRVFLSVTQSAFYAMRSHSTTTASLSFSCTV